MSALTASSFTILWQLILTETVKYIFNEWKQSMSAQFAKCVCVQHLALSATTHCRVIFLMTPVEMVPRDSKTVMADQEMVQADHFKGDQDDFMFPLIKTLIYLSRFKVDSSEH